MKIKMAYKNTANGMTEEHLKWYVHVLREGGRNSEECLDGQAEDTIQGTKEQPNSNWYKERYNKIRDEINEIGQ